MTLDNEINQQLILQNPWWENPNIQLKERFFAFKRKYYPQVLKYLKETKLIISLVGLRRVGKSTIIKQLMSNLISKGQAKKVCYFSFEKNIFPNTAEYLQQIITEFVQNISPFSSIHDFQNGEIYIFLDEIQRVDAWADVLKLFYDMNNNIRFIISGSASYNIRKSGMDSLAGRMAEVSLQPLSYSEYLELTGKKIELPKIEIENARLFDEKEIAQFAAFGINQAQAEFDQYLTYGQFPEIANINDMALYREYLQNSVFNKILEQDIPQLERNIDSNLLKQLFFVFVHDSGNVFEFKNISIDLSMAQKEIISYTNILIKTFLLDKIDNFNRSARKSSRLQKKYFVASSNFAYSLFGINPLDKMFNETAGHWVEGYVYWQLKEKYRDINFLRRREKEIDFIAKLNGELILLEVKYSARLRSQDLDSMKYFIDKYKIKKAFVLSKNNFDSLIYHDCRIEIFPAFLL